ncbi:SPOPL, partial [Cordylochernes scorpioides]
MSLKNQLSDTSSNPIADISCYTVVKEYNCSHIWTIDNFSHYSNKSGIELMSSFYFESIGNVKLNLFVYPNGLEGRWGWVSAILKPDIPESLNQYFKKVVAISILNFEKKEKFIKNWNFDIKAIFNDFITREVIFDNAEDLLPEDKLTLYCKLTFYEASTISICPIEVPECSILEDFGSLLESGEFSDVILKAEDNREIHVHKNILSARSLVFAAMLKNEFKEKNENYVDLSHIKYEVLVEIIKYIYTGKSENLAQLVEQILPIADMYQLERLKLLCERELGTKVTIDTATEILIFAEQHSAKQLKEYTLNFIKANSANVLKSTGWKILTSYPQLFTEVFTVLTNQQLTFSQFSAMSEDQTQESVSNPTADIYFYTVNKVYSCSCIWTVEDFSTRPEKNGEYITSSSFTSENIKDLKWNLYIYPNGSKGNGSSVSAFLRTQNAKGLEDYFKKEVEISILNKNKRMTSKTISTLNDELWFKDMIKREFLFEKAADLLPDDKLTLYCQVTLHQTSTTNIVIPITNPFKICNCGLMKDFDCLLESKEFSDVILRAENNQEIHAHKNILSARSSVFAAMFKNEMKEKKENCVDLCHIKYEILEQVIYYIYTDSCPKLSEMADKILPLADMYDLENLKIQCEKELITKLTRSVLTMSEDQTQESESNPTADTYFYTIDKVYSCSCMWIIENFSTRPEKNEEYIKSNSFSSGNIKDLKWNLYIYLNGNKSNGGSVSAFLRTQNAKGLEDYFKKQVEISILNKNKRMTSKKISTLNDELWFNDIIKREFLFEKAADLLPDDKLTLYCQVTLHQTSTTNIVIPITNPIKVCNCGLMKDFGCLLESKEFSDVILRAENNQEIHAHKNILSARSSVFAAMFKNEMKEKKENCVDLSHIKYEILEQVIYYIYTDSCPKLCEMADKILPLANMYDLEILKIMCEKELITK